MNDDQLLTITETAELLRAPVATLRWWRHTGQGPRSFKIGRRVSGLTRAAVVRRRCPPDL